VVSADLLLHVRDIAHPDSEAQRADVEQVLEEIGVTAETPRIEAWNKLDLLDAERRADLLDQAARRDDVMPISVLTGEGMPALIEQVAAKLTAGHRRYHLVLDAADGAAAAWLHAHGEVLDQRSEEEGVRYEVRLAPADYERFMRRGV
jgi:GTP-binding protein HflX